MVSEQNKTLVRRFFEETDKGNLDIVDELYADNHRFYQPGSAPMNKEAHKQLLTMYRNVFPDSTQTVQEMIAEGDNVVTRFTFRGTQKGELMGIPPTGKPVVVEAVVIDRISGGKIVEEWTIFDSLGMMHQLGVVPASQGTEK